MASIARRCWSLTSAPSKPSTRTTVFQGERSPLKPAFGRPLRVPNPRMRRQTRQSAPLTVVYHIAEGKQQRVARCTWKAMTTSIRQVAFPCSTTAAGQLLSPQNLAGDRDALLTDYLSRGFDQARVEVGQQPDPADASTRMLSSISPRAGSFLYAKCHHRPALHPPRHRGQGHHAASRRPSTQPHCQQTQLNLYDFALFNEVGTAVENPNGPKPTRPCCCRQLKRGGGPHLRPRLRGPDRNPAKQLQGIAASASVAIPTARPESALACSALSPANNLFGREHRLPARHLRPVGGRRSIFSTRIRISTAIATSASPSPVGRNSQT